MTSPRSRQPRARALRAARPSFLHPCTDCRQLDVTVQENGGFTGMLVKPLLLSDVRVTGHWFVTTTTEPPRRGSPPPDSVPSAARSTAWQPPKNRLRSRNGAIV